MTNYLNLILLWLLFYALHSAMAASQVKAWIAVAFPAFVKPYRIFYNMVSLLLFGVAYAYQMSIADTLLFQSNLVRYAGLVLVVVSIILMYASFKNYDLKEFLGVSQWQSNSFNAAISNQLQIHGLNQYVRHPLYTACYLFFAAYFLYKPYVGSTLFSLMGFIYLYVGAKWEEKKLAKQFGDAYLFYQKQVPMFLPWPWPRSQQVAKKN